MVDEIKPIPDLPPGLAEAALRNRLVPFVGAGASMVAGCPSWGEFADGALKFFIEKQKFTFGQLDQVKHLHPRVKLALALGLQTANQIDIDFRQVLRLEKSKADQNGRKLYEHLAAIGSTFVTTNYDDLLDTKSAPQSQPIVGGDAPASKSRQVSRNVFYKVSDLTPYNLGKPDSVFHLHGWVHDPATMIMTTQHYVKHYANDRMGSDAGRENYVLTFLDTLFTQKNVLFVGYGLEELEILEYVIGKARLMHSDRREIRHYILQGFFSHEYEVMRSLEAYYLESGIQLIPFSRDQRNWEQLIEVLEDFAKRMPATATQQLEKLARMGELLND